MLAEITSPTPQQWLVILALTLFIIVMFNISRRRRQSDGSPKQYRREIDGATRQNAAMRKDLEALIVELNELARVVNGQIETRFAKLEHTIKDADERIRTLRDLLEQAESLPASPTGSRSGVDIVVNDETDRDVIERAVISANRAASSFATSDPVSIDDPPQETAVDVLHRRVYALSDAGKTALEIAETMDRAVGEIELILHLRRRAATSQPAGPSSGGRP